MGMNRTISRTTLIGLVCFLGIAGCQNRPSFQFGAYSQAEKFYEKGKYEKAIAKYEEYIRENPRGNMAAIAYYDMAKCYEALKRYERAREIYQKITQEYSGLVWVDFAKARLKELPPESPPSTPQPS